MIAYLKGIVSEIEENSTVIEVSGVGYLVYASSNTLQNLKIGEAFTLYTEMIVREDSLTLYGFYDKKEQFLFRLLTTVQGVGPKVCLGILSSLPAESIYKAISSADTKLIGKANGVGPKLATRIVSELKGKVDALSIETNIKTAVLSQQNSSDFSDAVSALVNLGYSRSDAVFAVDKVISANPDAKLPAVIRMSLKSMGNK